MAKTQFGLIRVVSFKDDEIAQRHGRLIEKTYPDLEVSSRCIGDQPRGIYDDETEAQAVPKIVELGVRFAQEGRIAGLIISCAADPAVEELRAKVQIPVIGAGSAAAGLALAYGNRVGTLGITEDTPAAMKAVLGAHLVAEAKPQGVMNTLDLMNDEGRSSALAAVSGLKDQGAEVIALACTGYSTIGIAGELEKEAGIPVVDAVLAAGLAAWFLSR
jgi:Asp/Glu/hydantoin racemase